MLIDLNLMNDFLPKKEKSNVMKYMRELGELGHEITFTVIPMKTCHVHAHAQTVNTNSTYSGN